MRGFKQEVNECCGTCKWHVHEDTDDGWVCCNADSDYVTEWTEYDDWCNQWQGRHGRGGKE